LLEKCTNISILAMWLDRSALDDLAGFLMSHAAKVIGFLCTVINVKREHLAVDRGGELLNVIVGWNAVQHISEILPTRSP